MIRFSYNPISFACCLAIAGLLSCADASHASLVVSLANELCDDALRNEPASVVATGLVLSTSHEEETSLGMAINPGRTQGEGQAPDSQDDDGYFVHSAPGNMSPANVSLSQTSGSGVGGAALTTCLDCPIAANILVFLSPESRVLLPGGPVWRWFRPPRV